MCNLLYIAACQWQLPATESSVTLPPDLKVERHAIAASIAQSEPHSDPASRLSQVFRPDDIGTHQTCVGRMGIPLWLKSSPSDHFQKIFRFGCATAQSVNHLG